VSTNDTEAALCGGTRPAGSVMLVFCFEKARSMLSSPLTPRQAAILEFVRAFIASHGYPPTIREIGRQFGIPNPTGVTCHLRALEKKGAIRRSPNCSRAIVPTAA
jgi:repressor LexA